MSAAQLTRVLLISLAVLAFVQVAASAADPKTELLWPAGAPGAKGDSDNDKPTLTIYLPPPDQATGAAVVVCPGG
ncbi:MAG TPA: alpha/beta hydrolase, partial [Pirellulales bacterium]